MVSNFPNKSISTRILHTQAFPGKLSESSLSKHLACVSRTYSQPQPVNQVTYLLLFAYLQTSCRSSHCPNTSLVSPGLTPNLSLLIKSLTYFSLLISRQVVGVLIVQTPHLCLQDLLPTSACRDILKHFKTCRFRQSIDKSPSSNDLTANMPERSETKTCHLNQEYSSSSMPLALHQQCTNLVITSEP